MTFAFDENTKKIKFTNDDGETASIMITRSTPAILQALVREVADLSGNYIGITTDDETVDDETVDDETVDDETVDDETVDDETVDDETVDDETVDDETVDDETTE